MAAKAISAKVNTLLNTDKKGTLQSTNEETQPTTHAQSTPVGESAPIYMIGCVAMVVR